MSGLRAALATGAIGLVLGAADASAVVVLEQGHVDYGVRLVDGAVRSQVKDGTSGSVVWREVADVRVRLTGPARTTVPADPAYGFLGAPGARVWLIPQTQQDGVVWLGWNTEELGGGRATGTVGWSLDAVEGPGTVATFQTDVFGRPVVAHDSRDGLPDVREVPLGVHAHGNWAFSHPGTYALTFTHRVQTAGGPQADTERLVVEVADAEGGTAPPGPGSGGDAGASGAGNAGDAVRPPTGAPPATSTTAAAAIAVERTTLGLSRSRRVAVRVQCRTATRACRGTVVLRTAARLRHEGGRQRVTIGRRAYRVAAGRTAAVKVPVRRGVARTLRARPVTAVTATVTREGGATVRAALRLRSR